MYVISFQVLNCVYISVYDIKLYYPQIVLRYYFTITKPADLPVLRDVRAEATQRVQPELRGHLRREARPGPQEEALLWFGGG